MNPKEQFWTRWPSCINSIRAFYGELTPQWLEKIENHLGLREKSSTNEIEKALRELWDFDEGFVGDLFHGFNPNEYEWAVYSLCYLCEDEETVQHILNIYPPLLGKYIKRELGGNFCSKVQSTFIGEVNHVLWEVQELEEPGLNEMFNWSGNRNYFPEKQIEEFLEYADFPLLVDPDIPPRRVYLYFNYMHDPFESDEEYEEAMRELSYW